MGPHWLRKRLIKTLGSGGVGPTTSPSRCSTPCHACRAGSSFRGATRVPEFTVTAGERNGWAVVELGGEIDLDSGPRLQEVLDEMIDGGARRVVVELGRVEFIDSSGLAALITALKHMRRAEGELRLAGLTSNVAKVFDICRLNRVFGIHASVDEAVRS